jgi:hypothetical protein
MRRKIFDIYKALRHFNVTAGEVRDIAEGYRYWIANPFESRPPYNTVYGFGNRLYSLPYSDNRLEDNFVGIEIDGVIYLAIYVSCSQNQIAKGTEYLKKMIGITFNGIDQFKLRMPTKDEARILVEKTLDDGSLGTGLICNKCCDVWITPNPDHPERTFATVKEHSARPHQPSENTQAVLYLVTCPDEEQAFFGEVNEYATPTPETQEVYTKLRNIV